MRCLYHLPLSPFCRKIRLVLSEKKLDVVLLEEPVWEKRLDFIRLNPASKVPVLKIDGLIISESNKIFRIFQLQQLLLEIPTYINPFIQLLAQMTSS